MYVIAYETLCADLGMCVFIHESLCAELGVYVIIYEYLLTPGPRLNIKTVLSTYGDFHVKDKTAVRTSYL